MGFGAPGNRTSLLKQDKEMLNYKIKIVDGFLNEADLKELLELSINLNSNTKFSIYHNEIDIHDNVMKESVGEQLLKRLNRNYLNRAIKILEELNYEKVKLVTHSDFTIIKTKKDAKFPIHDDTPNKLLSGVIYLYPKNNSGTVFYSNKSGENKKVIDWKTNRAVFFSRKERETWHSYKGDGVNDRIALVYNLMTSEKNLKKVYDIENKNYLLGKLRYKLNPYIFQYFKKTI